MTNLNLTAELLKTTKKAAVTFSDEVLAVRDAFKKTLNLKVNPLDITAERISDDTLRATINEVSYNVTDGVVEIIPENTIVIVRLFSSLPIGIYKADKEEDGWGVALKNGYKTFDFKTLVEIDAENPKYSSYLEILFEEKPKKTAKSVKKVTDKEV